MTRRVLAALMTAIAIAPALPAGAESPEITPEHWKMLTKAVRIVKRDYVTAVEDARLAAACVNRVHALPPLAAKRPVEPVTQLADVPVVLRAAVEASPGVAPGQVVEECLAGLFGSLDAQTRFIPPDEGRELMLGAGAGVGLELRIYEGTVFVVDVFEGSPAAGAGIRAGDRVAAIAGRSLDGLALHEVVRLLRGRVGTPVTVTIARGTDVLELPMTRAVVRVPSVKTHVIEPGYLHLRIPRFEERTLAEIDAAVGPLLEKAATTPRAIVIDLRDNGGGVLRVAVDLAAAFLPPGAVVGSTDGRNPTAKRRLTGERRSIVRDAVAEWLRTVPATVLVNGGTASGAEIVAAALQSHGRARVFGTPTAGFGSLQSIFPLDEGGYARVTTAIWLTPKGESFDGRSVAPDVLLMMRGPGASDAELEQAIEIMKTGRAAPR